MTLYLEAQSLVVVCPDCGQRYDPAKAAKVARVRTRDGRTIKPGRVEAQDVGTAAHRNGRHHRAHVEVTQRALDGWTVVTREVASLAYQSAVRTESKYIDGATALHFMVTEELEALAIEIEDEKAHLRAQVERWIRATRAVRVDHPWWRAFLHELGVSAEEIAHGLTIGVDNRGDVLFERRTRALPQPGPTLRGLL